MAHLGSKKQEKVGAYFDAPTDLVCIQSGSTLLDCAVTGGNGTWPIGRLSNIVGDRALGKTLLAIEACANFARQFPKGQLFYREAEAAFDLAFAERVGLPTKRVNFWKDQHDTPFDTVEDMSDDIDKILDKADGKQPILYIVDSLDALSDRATMDRKITEASFNMTKQKKIGEIFSKQIRRLQEARVALIIISQLRFAIGVTFGEKYRRSGGKALDFYESLEVWLHNAGQEKKTIDGIDGVIGNNVKVKVKKNKIGPPFKECEFLIKFNYGVDDLSSCVNWLEKNKRLKDALEVQNASAFIREIEKYSDVEYREICGNVAEITRKQWREAHAKFQPTRAKYA